MTDKLDPHVVISSGSVITGTLMTPNLVTVDEAIAKLDQHFKKSQHLRYGQMFLVIVLPRFVWPELFYQTSVGKCREMIRQWIIDNQCADRVVREIEQSTITGF